MSKKTELIPRWCGELAHYFRKEGTTPDDINYCLHHACLTIATKCAHPQEIEVEDLELIACTLSYLSEIVEIVDKYEMT